MKLTAEQMENVARALSDSAFRADSAGHFYAAEYDFNMAAMFRDAAAQAHAPGYSRNLNKEMAELARRSAAMARLSIAQPD